MDPVTIQLLDLTPSIRKNEILAQSYPGISNVNAWHGNKKYLPSVP